MKFNKWTLGLAAVGAVSMASAVRADEAAKLVPVETALTGTTISGYVDVAAQYTPGDPGQTAAYNQPWGVAGSGNSKVDNFSINSVTITLEKPLDDSAWASGYRIDLNGGTDAYLPLQNSSGDGFGLRQGYVALRTPVGNGIDWKVGLFDGVTGYEANTGYLNPNYTRSYGWMVNPASEAGAIGAYKVCDVMSVQLGMANRMPSNGTVAGLSSHDYLGTVSLTAPEDFGFLKGSVLNFGTVQTFDNGGINNYSVNATLNTPVTGLKFGLSFDKVSYLNSNAGDANIYGVYAIFQATEKLSFNLRGEVFRMPAMAAANGAVFGTSGKGEEITATVQYDLWANVVSRVEFRWDHVDNGNAFNNGSHDTTTPSTQNAYLLALNLVYKF